MTRMNARTFPVMHPRLPDVNETPVCIGDRLVFEDPDDPDAEVIVEVVSLHYDHTEYSDGEGPLGWVVTDRDDDLHEYPIEEVIRVESLGPDRWGEDRGSR